MLSSLIPEIFSVERLFLICWASSPFATFDISSKTWRASWDFVVPNSFNASIPCGLFGSDSNTGIKIFANTSSEKSSPNEPKSVILSWTLIDAKKSIKSICTSGLMIAEFSICFVFASKISPSSPRISSQDS